MLRQRTAPNVLNAAFTQRLSLVFAWSAILFLSLALVGPKSFRLAAVILATAAAIAVTAANFDFYRFFARRRGAAFAVAAIPMHWLYYGYCGLALLIALPIHFWHKAAKR